VVRPDIIRVNRFNEMAVTEFRRSVQRAVDRGQPIIPIVIDSYGGLVHSLLAMVDILEQAKPHAVVATICEGKAMSCGAVLLACGAKGHRYVGTNATVMLHDTAGGSYGKIREIKAHAAESERLDAQLFSILDKNAGKKAGTFKKIIHDAGHAELYMSPSKCVSIGLADSVGLPQMGVHVSVRFTIAVPKPTKASRGGK
jgi:ATP-dependent Clp protease, protease subunit